jgi:hypothetical protein
MYFIDPQGCERFLASPMADHRWRILPSPHWPALRLGQGIALVARQLVG